MSGILTYPIPEGLCLLTDGANVDLSHRLQHVGSKVLLMPEWPGAMALRGPAQFLWALRTHWGPAVPDFDGILARITEDAELIEQLHILHQCPRREWELVLTGWSQARQAFEVWDVYGGPIPPFEHPPLTLRQIPAGAGAWPAPEPEQVAALGLTEQSDPPRSPHHTAALVMVAMRHSLQKNPNDERDVHHSIGGFLQETIISLDGCSTRIVHRWPDVIGERITPSPVPQGSQASAQPADA